MTVPGAGRDPDPGGSGGVPLWHLLPIALVLLASSFVVGHRGYVFIDEAALLAQVELVSEGSWTVERPLAHVDPEGQYAPMARSTLTDDGFAPFPNHPLHVLVATAASEVGGEVGIRLASIAGVLGAAAAAGWLASAMSRRHAAAAMWITGVASPLIFDANLVLAHALTAGLTGAVFVLVFGLGQRSGDGVARTSGLAAGVATLVAGGALLRSEVVLLGCAVGVVAAVRGIQARSGGLMGTGLAAVLGAAFAYVVEPWWVDSLVGAAPGQKVLAASARWRLDGVLDGAEAVLFGLQGAGMAVALTALLIAGAVLALRLRPDDSGPAALLAVCAAIAASFGLADPRVVPGILWAFPLVWIAVATPRRWSWPSSISRSLEAAAVFALAVLATQYAEGGGAEWGWRYVAVALPALGSALSVPLVHLSSARPAPARLALVGIVVASLLVPAGGILAQRHTAERVAQLLDRTDAVLASTGADIVVAADPSFGRYAWPGSIAGDVVTVERSGEELTDLLDLLTDQQVDRILLVWVGDEPVPPPELAEPGGEVAILLARAYAARPYDLVPNTRSPS